MKAIGFSGHAGHYARFRPGYPDELFEWLSARAPGRQLAWDCGCGNGQASVRLAHRFQHVVATDISPEQIAAAFSDPRVAYRVAPAEDSGLPAASCDLVTVAQALHWFKFDRFYAEARRVLKPGGLFAAWTYQLLRIDGDIGRVFSEFHARNLASWWPPERRWVNEGYRTLPFPFTEIAAPAFEIRLSWTLLDLLGYIGTWTATRQAMQAARRDPASELEAALRPLWGDGRREITWPIAMRAGYVD